MTIAYRLLIATAVLSFKPVFAQAYKPAVVGAVEPWHQQNANPPAVVPEAAAAVNPHQLPGQPVRYPVQAQEAKKPGDGGQQMQQFMQQAMQALGGRSEIVGTGGNGMDSPVGHSTSLDISGGAGVGANGMPLVNINGCTTVKGRFQFKGGHTGAGGCDAQVTISEEFSEFLNTNLARCANIAAGNSYFEVGKIWHAGTLPSKEHLAKSPKSLHNFGNAIDITGIQMDNRTFDFKKAKSDPAVRQFVDKFRQCWGQAVESKRSGCGLGTRKGGHAHGTIGHEDHDHQNHLHLSLPFCRQTAQSLGGVNIALKIFESWFLNLAHAQTKTDEPEDLPRDTYKYKSLAVHGGKAKLTIKNTNGEPVSAGYRLSLEVTCTKGQKKTVIWNEHPACDFDDIKYDKKKGTIEVLYRTADFVDGRVLCRKSEVAKFKGRCP